MSRVLLIGSKREIKKLTTIFGGVKVSCEGVLTFEEGFDRISKDPPSLVVVEKEEGIKPLMALQATLQKKSPATPFFVTLPKGDMTAALEAMQAGAFDCLSKPYSSHDALFVAKRATMRYGRLLFAERLNKPKKHVGRMVAVVLTLLALGTYLSWRWGGPPAPALSLGSANLAGIQWDGRDLWVTDWFDSTISQYEVKKGFLPSGRPLVAKNIYKMQEGQPILVCNTQEFLVTIGSDLKMRVHRRAVGLPSFQTFQIPSLTPVGLGWDGKNIWSADGQTNFLYKHGEDLRVIDRVKSILPGLSGLAWDGQGFWIVGGKPLKAARFMLKGGGVVWSGPFELKDVLTNGVAPTGLAVGYERLWFVSGGDPKMTSCPLPKLTVSFEKKK